MFNKFSHNSVIIGEEGGIGGTGEGVFVSRMSKDERERR